MVGVEPQQHAYSRFVKVRTRGAFDVFNATVVQAHEITVTKCLFQLFLYLTGPVFAIIMLLASLNSCTNPWIYLYYS